MATISEVKQTLIDAIQNATKAENITPENLATLSGAFAQVAYIQEPKAPRSKKSGK